MKKSFLMYLDQQDLFNKLPDDVAGKLIKHIFSYVNCENPVADDLLLEIAFSSIKQALKRDLEKWQGQLEQRSLAGKKSAEKRALAKQREATNPTSVESRSTNPTDSVSVNVSVSDKDKTLDQDKLDHEFEQVWDLYGKKGNKKTSKKKWSRLSENNKQDIYNHLPIYTLSTPDKQYRKNFETYINQECWNDEVIARENPKGFTTALGQRAELASHTDDYEKAIDF